jgi:predicted DNA-binding ribbon-helix-helix protein
MCQFYASQSPESYAFETRSIRLNGQSTSIRLEKIFWTVIAEIARQEGSTVPRFISTLHRELLLLRGEAPNFSSHLRCICLVAIENRLLQQEWPNALTAPPKIRANSENVVAQ